MNLIKKLINRILIVISGFLILVIGILFFFYWNQNKELGCATKSPESVCGNNSTNLSEKAQKGKVIFNTNCAACHRLYEDMTGPTLSKIDSIKLWNWLTEKNEKADSTKFSEVKIDYHKNLWSKNYGEEQLNELYEFIKTQ